MARLTPAARKRKEITTPVVEDDPAFRTNAPADIAGISGQRLRAFIERIERVREEIRGLQDDVKEIKAEAKGTGFSVKVINHLIKLRQQDADDLEEFETEVDIYKRAIGMAPLE